MATTTGQGGSGGPLMVGVSGLRGIVGGSLTADVVARYASAWAEMVGEGSDGDTPHLSSRTPTSSPPRGEVAGAERRGEGGKNARGDATRPVMVVGRDGRAGGEAIERMVVEALDRSGCEVVRLGVAMTPTVGVMVRALDAAGGLVVTASHNPGEWNGLKPITPEGSAPMPSVAGELVSRFERARVGSAVSSGKSGVSGGGGREHREAAQVHVDRVIDAVSRVMPIEKIRARRMRVVVDSVNASGVVGARLLLDRLGCVVTHMHAEDTGVFPHGPEPTAENLGGLCEAVVSSGAEVGFAQDPDGDRLALVDGAGVYIGEEYTVALASLAVLESMPAREAAGAVVAANLSTSRMIDDVAGRFGARVVRTAVGEANVVDGMRRHGAVVGGEGNGGVIWPAVVEIRDSLVGMALVLALMARRGGGRGALEGAVEEIPRYAIEKRKMAIAPGMEAEIAERVRGAFAGARVDAQDGIRVDFAAPSGQGMAWVHARRSNTEPIYRLIAEAPTGAEASAILDRVHRVG